MPAFLVVYDTDSGQGFQGLTAADLDSAAQAIKARWGAGFTFQGGVAETIRIGLLELDAAGTITPNPNGPATVNYTRRDPQPAIADLPIVTVTSLAQANTALQTIATKVNTLLAELRAAGVIAT